MLGNLNQDIDKIKQSISSSLSNVRTDSLTLFDVTTDKLKEGVALKTNNDLGVATTINDYKDTIVSKLNGVIGQLSAGNLNVDNITNSIKAGLDGINFNAEDLMNSVSKDLGLNLRGNAGIVAELTKDIVNEFSRVALDNPNPLLLPDGSNFRVGDNWRSPLGDQILSNITNCLNIDGYIDTGVITSVRNTMFLNAIKLGLSDSFAALFDCYPPGMNLYKRDVVLEGTSISLRKGDITSATKLIELLDPTDRVSIGSKNPDLVKDLFTNFTFDRNTKESDHPKLLDDLKFILKETKGEEWDSTDTHFGKAIDFNMLQNVSPDMKQLLSNSDEMNVLLCSANMFTETNGNDYLRSSFPTAPRYER